jgi:hypothetical protein
VLSVIVTAAAMIVHHNHVLHIAHLVLVVLTFTLIALYLQLSCISALKYAVNTVMSKSDIECSLTALIKCAGLKTLAAEGNYPDREGYDITKSVFSQLGITLSNNANDCELRIVLGEGDGDIILKQNKITHLLKVYYIARVYSECRFIPLFGAVIADKRLVLINFERVKKLRKK